jgi:hypothetical protein
MIHLPNVKLACVIVLAMVASLRDATRTRTAEGIAGFTLNLAPAWTQSNAQVMADLPLAKVPLPPGTGLPEDPQKPGGTRGGACQQTISRLRPWFLKRVMKV